MLSEWNDELTEVSPDDAFIDKMDIKFGFGLLDFRGVEGATQGERNAGEEVHEGDDEDILLGHRRAVSRSDTLGRADSGIEGRQEPLAVYNPVLNENGTNSNSRGWIFNIASGSGSYWEFKVASGTRSHGGHYPRPLFGGKMRFRYSAQEVWRVRVELQLNFCRLCYYNGLNWITNHRRRARTMPIWTFAAEEQRPESDEISLDGKDNWLPGEKINRLRWSRVRRIQEGYLEHIERQIRWHLVSAESRTDGSANEVEGDVYRQHAPDYTLRYCEIAWEFAHENPVQAVRDLFPVLQAYRGELVRSSEYQLPDNHPATEETEGYSVCCRLQLPYDNELAIYSKTNRRIRIEMRYRLYSGDSPRPLDRKTADSRGGVLNLVEQLRDHATGQVNHFLAFVRSRNRPVMGHRFTVQEFLDHVYSCTTHVTRQEVLRALVELGRLPKTGRGEFLEVARALRDRGVVSCERGSRIYRVTPAYSNAVELLRGIRMFTPRFCDRNGRVQVIGRNNAENR